MKTITRLGIIAMVLFALGFIMILPWLALIALGTWIVQLVLGA